MDGGEAVITNQELEAKLTGLGDLPDETKKKVVCALVGHSRIVRLFWGQVTCGRCGAVVGDTIANATSVKEAVIVGHNCEECQANYAKLGWEHKFLTQDPLAPVVAGEDKP